MNYWIRKYQQATLLIRAASDPLENLDTTPQVWDWDRRQWIDDDDIVDDMQWDPNIRAIPEPDALHLTSSAQLPASPKLTQVRWGAGEPPAPPHPLTP